MLFRDDLRLKMFEINVDAMNKYYQSIITLSLAIFAGTLIIIEKLEFREWLVLMFTSIPLLVFSIIIVFLIRLLNSMSVNEYFLGDMEKVRKVERKIRCLEWVVFFSFSVGLGFICLFVVLNL